MTIKQAQDQLKEAVASYYIKENNRLKDKIKNMEKEASDKKIAHIKEINRISGIARTRRKENEYLNSKIASESLNNIDVLGSIDKIVDSLKDIHKNGKIVVLCENSEQSEVIYEKLSNDGYDSSTFLDDFICYRNLKFLCLSPYSDLHNRWVNSGLDIINE